MNKNPKRVAGYIRMSTDKQKMSPVVQQEKIANWFKQSKTNGTLPEDAEFIGMFVDLAVSSSKPMFLRPAGEQLLVALKPGDVVVAASLSRAFRSAGDCEQSMNRIAELGASMVFLDVNIDTSTPTGKMFLGILSVMTQFEREIIAERTKEGLAARRKGGFMINSAPYAGWKAVKRNPNAPKKPRRMIPDYEYREAAIKIYNMIVSEPIGWLEVAERGSEVLRSLPSGRYQKCRYDTVILAAVSAALDFPKISQIDANRILGHPIGSLKFVRYGDHEKSKRAIRKAMEEEDYKCLDEN